MKITGICLLMIYVLVRIIPFVITGYLILFARNTGRAQKQEIWRIQRLIPAVIGWIADGTIFLGIHYLHYRNFEIIGYIKNIYGMNFYHQDVEYFALSAAVCILASVVIGIFCRLFFGDVTAIWLFTKKQEYTLLGAGFLAFVLVILGFEAEDYFQSKIKISEVCSNNQSYVLDGNALIEDYVELQNVGKLPCQINSLYLSDNEFDLKRQALKDMVIPAGGVVVVPCVEGINSFSISNKGETIYLSNEEGRILEEVCVVELEDDTAYVKINYEENAWETGACTPGVSYDEMLALLVEAPVLSHQSGFYDSAFELHITGEENTTIYYTLDGSLPDEGSYLYEEAIKVYDRSMDENVWNSVRNIVTGWEEYEPITDPVPKAFIIRAVAVDNEGNKSDVVTASYFVGCRDFRDKNVVSLIASPEDLFGGTKGIYVTGEAYDTWYLNGQEGEEPTPHFSQSGKEWERAAVFELLEENQSVLQQNVGIRIQGNSTRNSEAKRFNVYARPEYSHSTKIQQDVFEEGISPASLLIHTSFEDALNQSLMEGRDIAIQKAKPISFFLNGEFWYDGYLRQKYSKHYFKDYYDVEKDNLILYKGGELEEGVETDSLLYQELYDFAQTHDFSDDTRYDELAQMMDVQSYIEFLCGNIYCANMDMDEIKNVVMWRSREVEDSAYGDGRWRWALYDMDAVGWTSLRYYEIKEEAEVNSFSKEARFTGYAFNKGILYTALKQNERFDRQFVLTFMDLLNTNFSVENAKKKLQEYGEDITWLNSFFAKRPEYMKKYLAEEFNLTGKIVDVTLYNEDEAKGSICMNTITPQMQNGSWTGEYYTDYPVTVTAIPKEGYEFVGWSGSVESSETSIEVPVTEEGVELRAEFQAIR